MNHNRKFDQAVVYRVAMNFNGFVISDISIHNCLNIPMAVLIRHCNVETLQL